MQTYLNNHPAAIAFIFPVFFVALWCAIAFLISQISGWAVLARRFRLTSTFTGQTWTWKKARMRWGCNYNNCLTLGSDPMGMYLHDVSFSLCPPAIVVAMAGSFGSKAQEDPVFQICRIGPGQGRADSPVDSRESG